MRKSHKKTRTGCTNCRRRRVKCDEGKPGCKNCERNGLKCSSIFLIPNKPMIAGRLPASQGHQVSESPSPATSAPELYLDVLPPRSLSPHLYLDSQTQRLDPQSLELLHHYRTTVFLTIATSATAKQVIWHTDIPRMGLSHPFLMYGTLAISALHLSHLQPSRTASLIALARTHEQAALPSFRALVSSSSRQNIHAVFAFSGIVVPYILTSSSGQARLLSRGDKEAHWFLAIRGLMPLVAENWEVLKEGPFGPLLVTQHITKENCDNPDDYELEKLEALFEPSANTPVTTTSPSELEVCAQALAILRRVFRLPYAPNKTWLDVRGAVFIWPGAVSQEFVDLLFERRPEALVLLAYFCVLLKRINSYWYFEGLGVGLLERVGEGLDSWGEGWREWIAWAEREPTV